MSLQHASATTPPPTTPSELVARGFALFPLRPGTKVPAVARDWEHAATTSPTRLWQLAPHAGLNYGVACGPSDLIVIDLDVAKGPGEGDPREDGASRELAEPAEDTPADGWSVLRGLAEAHGGEIPRTFTVRTPSGGRHLYFRPPVDGSAPRNTVRRLGPLIDTRGVGGYVVAPGSRVDGVEYRVIDDAPIAVLPGWIGALLRPMEDRPVAGEPLSLATALGPVRTRLGGAYARSALEREGARVAAARVGTRNDTLNRAAYSLGTLVGSGLLDRAEVELELTRAALAAGLDARETASTVRSGLTAGTARPRRLVGASAAADGVHRPALADSVDPAEARRALIPTLVPVPAEWPRVFGGHARLGAAVTAVHRELTAMVPGFELPSVSAIPTAAGRAARGPRGEDPHPEDPRSEDFRGGGPRGGDHGQGDPRREAGPAALGELLAELDDAYEAAARASGPIAGSARWQGVLTLVDALRDLNDELIGLGDGIGAGTGGGTTAPDGDLSAQAFTLVRALSSAAARQIAALAREMAVMLGAQGLRRSPLGNGVRRLQRSAEAVAALGAPATVGSLTPPGYATGRGALQAQLGAMRRDLRSAARSRPAAAA